MKPRSDPLLFTPLRLRDLVLRNRIVISPMAQCSADGDGMATDWHMVHLGRFAVGGAGLVFTEAVTIEAEGRYTHGDLGIWRDDQIVPLKRIADFLKRHGAVAGIQLWHAGRKAGVRRPWDGASPLDEEDARKGEPPWQVVGPSAVPGAPGGVVPRALTIDEIQRQKESWRLAARRALSAGFEVIEVHGAHGYLLHQFLSSMSNRRNDHYGGDLEGRMRFPLEIAEIVRQEWPDDKPVFFRLSAGDEGDPSWTMDDVIAFVSELKRIGVDVIDCSSGGIGSAGFAIKGRRVPGYQVGLAAEIRRRAKVSTMGVGLITEARQAEGYLQQGSCDLVAIGREALFDSQWAVHAARELDADPEFALWPKQYGWWLEYRQRTVMPDPSES